VEKEKEKENKTNKKENKNIVDENSILLPSSIKERNYDICVSSSSTNFTVTSISYIRLQSVCCKNIFHN
jgi:hypothetical protein